MTKQALAYYRVSTDIQKEEGTIEIQKTKVREFAIKNDYIIINEFSDDGVSGGLAERPGLRELLDTLNNTEVSITDYTELIFGKLFGKIFNKI
jgi:site-specific DNA recombinase